MKHIQEGSAKLSVPDESLTKKSTTFYNPAMEHQRDVTIAALKAEKPETVLDPLAATGVRGIRILKEVGSAEKVVFNDRNPSAVKYIGKNLKLNRIPKRQHEIHGKNANELFLENERYDYVDIDPFGSPVKFFPDVAHALKKDSLIGVTATDTGALAGKFSNACFRRYGVINGRTDFPKEMGIRVLITFILRDLARYDLTFRPLYSHANHYFRVIGKIAYGPDKNLSGIKMVSYCPECHAKFTGAKEDCGCGGKMDVFGPLWTGKIQDRAFCKKMLGEFNFKYNPGRKELSISTEEIDVPFYYDLHKLSKSMGKGSPNMEKVIGDLRDKGFRASRSHLCLTAIKTDADVGTILESF